MLINELLQVTVNDKASDLHLVVDFPPALRRYGKLEPMPGYEPLGEKQIEELIFPILNADQKAEFEKNFELDFSYNVEGLCRFRINLLWEKRGMSAVMRVIPSNIPSPEEIDLPQEVLRLTNLKNGLVVVTGPTGTGKSTTLAAMIEKINSDKNYHILTIEDPIEFVYTNKKSIVRQREVGSHTKSFANALKHALRQDPNVVLIGEMRDLETIAATLTIAETGHLAFATLHTSDASQTIDRIVDVFPPHQQQQIRTVLAAVLRGVVCQQLIPRVDGNGMVVAREVLLCDSAVANMIREGKTAQIYSTMQTGGSVGMRTMENEVKRLFQEGQISAEVALRSVNRPDSLRDLLSQL